MHMLIRIRLIMSTGAEMLIIGIYFGDAELGIVIIILELESIDKIIMTGSINV